RLGQTSRHGRRRGRDGDPACFRTNTPHLALYDLLLIGQATAKANVRDVILPWDLPVTKGLRESVHTREWERTFELFRLLIRAGHVMTTRMVDVPAAPRGKC